MDQLVSHTHRHLTNAATSGDQSRSFRHESVNIGQAFVPKVYRDVDDVRDEAEGGQGRVQE